MNCIGQVATPDSFNRLQPTPRLPPALAGGEPGTTILGSRLPAGFPTDAQLGQLHLSKDSTRSPAEAGSEKSMVGLCVHPLKRVADGESPGSRLTSSRPLAVYAAMRIWWAGARCASLSHPTRLGPRLLLLAVLLVLLIPAPA